AHRHPFGNTNNQRYLGVRRFHNGIGGKRRWHIDHTGVGRRLGNGASDRIEDRNAFERGAAFTGRQPGDHLSPVLLAGLGMKLSGGSGDTLSQNSRILVDQNCHNLTREEGQVRRSPHVSRLTPHAPFTACTIFSAASAIVSAEMIGSSESARIFRPNSTFVPCMTTTNGTLMLSSRAASTTPCASTSQRIMPPKILIKTPRTRSSERMSLKAWPTLSLVAPPPTSRKLAGSPPQSLIISIVAMAKPAPFTMQSILPSREI